MILWDRTRANIDEFTATTARGIEEVVRMFEHEARAGIFDGT